MELALAHAMVEVGAKSLLLEPMLQGLVSGGNQTEIGMAFTAAAQRSVVVAL